MAQDGDPVRDPFMATSVHASTENWSEDKRLYLFNESARSVDLKHAIETSVDTY